MCPSSKLGWKMAKSYCHLYGAQSYDRRYLALCHEESRGPRTGLCRSGGINNNNKYGQNVVFATVDEGSLYSLMVMVVNSLLECRAFESLCQ
ncbi:hypothetical protein TNCV_3653591 [Trichonephila clavipes]|nr:hypothetical protein TNCV_3653591 [Trichonephila clavipes]